MKFAYALGEYAKNIGYGGVDIFVFCAGIGAYNSLIKDNNVVRYIKRRIVRLIPTDWCFLIVWIPWYSYWYDMPFQAIIGNIFVCRILRIWGMLLIGI